VTILLTDLITRLQADAPAQAGVPSTAQYRQAVLDAVADLSRRASVTRIVTLAVVAGQASYPLPTDFQQLIRLAQIGVPYTPGMGIGESGGYGCGDYTLVTPAGLVPFSGSYREQITVTGSTLTVYPTPTTSADRQLVYAAGDALNVAGDGYDTLTDDRASIALLYAQATCMERIASSPQGDALVIESEQATIGRGRVDTTKRAEGLRGTATHLREQYLAAVASLVGSPGGLSWW